MGAREIAGSRSDIVHIPYDEAHTEGFEDMPRRMPDISKLKKYTGYAPKVTLDQIIEKVVAYQRSAQRPTIHASEPAFI